MNPQKVLFYVFMFIIGAIFGSFLCCQARRLHLREKGKKLGSRSVCLHCGKKLKASENLPIISWLIQKGRCKKCGQKIGAAEFLSELLTACAFLVLAVVFNIPFAPLNWAIFLATIILVCLLIFLAIYDGLYGELPTLFLTFSVICAIIIVILRIWSFFSSSLDTAQTAAPLMLALDPASGVILAPIISAAIFGGLYLILYLVSKGKWVGDGDWILCLALGLALGKPLLALIALFVANLSACLVMAPLVKKRKSHQIYFGPFLVAGYIITVFVASML